MLALGRAKAAVLALVVFMQVVAATMIGIFAFEETIGTLAPIGIVIIKLSGFYEFVFPLYFNESCGACFSEYVSTL